MGMSYLRQVATTMFSNKRATTAADFYVDPRDLPGLDNDSTLALYSGLLPAPTASSPTVNEGGSDPVLYFLLASSRHIARRPKLLVWFNGGPGAFDRHAYPRVDENNILTII